MTRRFIDTLREQARRQEGPQIEEPLPADIQPVIQHYLGRQLRLPAFAQWLGGSKEDVVKTTPLQLAEVFDVREQLIALIAGGPSFFNLTSWGKAFYVVKALLTWLVFSTVAAIFGIPASIFVAVVTHNDSQRAVALMVHNAIVIWSALIGAVCTVWQRLSRERKTRRLVQLGAKELMAEGERYRARKRAEAQAAKRAWENEQLAQRIAYWNNHCSRK